MRDLAILVILLSFLPLIFQRPWTGVLALAVFDYLNPHEYASGFMADFPVSKFLFASVVLATMIAVARKRQRLQWPPLDWRLILLLVLLGWFLFTTLDAKAPWLAWTKLRLVAKTFAVLGFTLLLIDTREKLFALVAVIAVCFALVAFKGAFWAFMTGFQDRVYGPPGSGYHDNNHFAVAAMMTLPLLTLLLRESRSRLLQALLGILMAACVIATLSSWSRGGLITLTVTLTLLALYSWKKLVVLPIMAVPLAALTLLPADWLYRMQSLTDPESAAAGRLAIWRLGLGYMGDEPFTGAGFQGWMYVGWRGGEMRDWHNAYIEILAEHGLIGLAIWGTLLLGTIASLIWRATQTGASAKPTWVQRYSSMLSVSLAAYAVGALSIGISYWPVYYHLILIAVILQHLPQNLPTAGVHTGLGSPPGGSPEEQKTPECQHF